MANLSYRSSWSQLQPTERDRLCTHLCALLHSAGQTVVVEELSKTLPVAAAPRWLVFLARSRVQLALRFLSSCYFYCSSAALNTEVHICFFDLGYRFLAGFPGSPFLERRSDGLGGSQKPCLAY